MTKPAVIITCMHRGLGAAPKLIGAGSVTSPTRRCCFATQEAKAKPTASMRLKRPSCWLVAGVSNLLFSVGFQFFRFCPRPRVLVLARLLGRNVHSHIPKLVGGKLITDDVPLTGRILDRRTAMAHKLAHPVSSRLMRTSPRCLGPHGCPGQFVSFSPDSQIQALSDTFVDPT